MIKRIRGYSFGMLAPSVLSVPPKMVLTIRKKVDFYSGEKLKKAQFVVA